MAVRDLVGLESGVVQQFDVDGITATCAGCDRRKDFAGALPVGQWECEDSPAEESVIAAACRFGDEGEPGGGGWCVQECGECVGVDRIVESYAVAGVQGDELAVWWQDHGAQCLSDIGPDDAPSGGCEEVGAED